MNILFNSTHRSPEILECVFKRNLGIKVHRYLFAMVMFVMLYRPCSGCSIKSLMSGLSDVLLYT